MFRTLKTAYALVSIAMKAKAAHEIFKEVKDYIPDSVQKKISGALTDVSGKGQKAAIEALEKYAPGMVDQLAARNKKDEPVTQAQVQEMIAQFAAAQNKATAGQAKPVRKSKKIAQSI